MSLPSSNPALDKSTGAENTVCTPEHCYQAFDALYCALTSATPITPEFPDDEYPLFVTWNTRSSRPERPPRLRGCIGSFEALPLHTGLAEYALISAFNDTRFNKIEASELERLECGISLLTDFEDADSYLDWTVGIHGIYITFPHPASGSSLSLLSSSRHTRRMLSATYLPDVIPEQGWDKVEAVDSAIWKAGWRNEITEDIRRSIKLRRYQSRKCTVGWEDYAKWREEMKNKI